MVNQKRCGIFYPALLAFFITPLNAHPIKNSSSPPNIGNYSLPTAQQPGPFYSFGQDIVDKGNLQLFFQPSFQMVVNEQYPSTILAANYGITNNLALLAYVPYAMNYIDERQHATGIGDMGLQGEYAFFNASDAFSTTQSTVLAAVNFPTGSARKNPATGFGAPSYFIGATYNRLYVQWYWYTSAGMTYIARNASGQNGAQYFYQGGLGRNIISTTNQFTLFGLVEIDGEFDEKNALLGEIDANSGGNTIFITPSITYATTHLMIQFGVSWPIIQQLNGEQDKVRYLTALNLIWTFY